MADGGSSLKCTAEVIDLYWRSSDVATHWRSDQIYTVRHSVTSENELLYLLIYTQNFLTVFFYIPVQCQKTYGPTSQLNCLPIGLLVCHT